MMCGCGPRNRTSGAVGSPLSLAAERTRAFNDTGAKPMSDRRSSATQGEPRGFPWGSRGLWCLEFVSNCGPTKTAIE